MNKAVAIWNSLDLSKQTNLECARAWFIEGFAHGETLKELTDGEIHDLIINKTTDADMIKQALRKAQEK